MTISPTPLSAGTAMPGRDWRLLAACRHADPDLFFPVSASGPSQDQVTQAKAICARCPVRRQCLAAAVCLSRVYLGAHFLVDVAAGRAWACSSGAR